MFLTLSHDKLLPQARHFLAVRQIKAGAGESWASNTELWGSLEVDGTSLGKFALKANCERLKKQIEALKAKLSRKGKHLPSVCFVHYQV